jgi:hypothetical protein
MGQAAEALGAHGPAALIGIGLEGLDGLGDRQRPRCRGLLGPCRCCGAATDPGAVGGALYTPPWVNWGPPVRRPLLGRSRNRAALCAVSECETGITFELTPPP